MVEHLADKPTGMNVEAWFAEVKQTANLNSRTQEQRFSLHGLPALRVRYQKPYGYEMESVYVISGSRTFEIGFDGDTAGRAVEKSRNYPTYRRMIETFTARQ